MFDGFLMSITNKLKKISASLDLYEGKFDEISTDVGTVNTAVSGIGAKVDTVQTTSDEIKSLISSEVASAKSEIISEVVASCSGGEKIPISSQFVDTTSAKSGTYVTALNISGKGTFEGCISATKYLQDGDSGCKIILDGNTIYNTYLVTAIGQSGNISLDFKKSLKIQVAGYKSNISSQDSYSVRAKGHVLFYE